MVMKPGKQLEDLPNIGRKIASRLNEAGIFSEEDLRKAGAVGAHRLIKERYPDETLPVCYYLPAFEGTLTARHWDAIGEERKAQLRAEVEAGKQGCSLDSCFRGNDGEC